MQKNKLIYDASDCVTQWVIDRIPHVSDFGPCYSIGILSNDKFIAGVTYHDYQKAFGTVQLSMAADSPLWAKRDTIHALLNYPFNMLECYRVFTLTPIDNTKAIAVNKSIGFLHECIAHSGFGKNRHAVSMRLLKPEYLRIYGEYENGQERTFTTSSDNC